MGKPIGTRNAMQEVLSPAAKAVEKHVAELLNRDNSGHGMDHIRRVLSLSLKFAEAENADREFVALVALLHDVDDYKLFGKDNAENLTNAKKIMSACDIDKETQTIIEQSICEIGYGKRLAGKIPQTPAGKIVSDADMCDGLGASGIIRVYAYGAAHGRPFFAKDIFPSAQVDAENYNKESGTSSVCHIFEKALKLKDLMLTESGRKEAESRHQFTVNFLEQLFKEESADEWLEYLHHTLINF